TLPTGSGKTRTAVESLVRWRLRSPARPGILWLTQSEELCEQAVQAFREVWFDLGRRSRKVRDTLQIARLWGDRSIPAQPDHIVVDWRGPEFAMDSDPQYREHFKQFQDFHPQFLQEIGQSRERNQELLKRMEALPEDWPTLFFGCTVEHAVAMAVLLRRKGRRAASVTGATRGSTRRALIEDFRHGGLSVLCNYGVLTTGFDAPRVRAVVIARPTTSPVLYEQMIGRGMRGPRFGGTDVCLVMDIADNIEFHGKLAYTRSR